jgi:hypothetical protein
MSHKATLWAIEQRGLKPTTKIILWHLCDRFNPDYGCFPSQQRLAQDCEISRSTLNEHLDRLEATGLLRRVPRIDPATKRQMATRYILGFEEGFAQRGPAPSQETSDGETLTDGGSGHPTEGSSQADVPDEPCAESTHGNFAGPRVRILPRAVSGKCPIPCENGGAKIGHGSGGMILLRAA